MVKQVSKSVKVTEESWSTNGREAPLRLRGEYLCEDNRTEQRWQDREENADGTRAY
jgi:hypothetical protein